jgi:hypothetical protein
MTRERNDSDAWHHEVGVDRKPTNKGGGHAVRRTEYSASGGVCCSLVYLV